MNEKKLTKIKVASKRVRIARKSIYRANSDLAKAGYPVTVIKEVESLTKNASKARDAISNFTPIQIISLRSKTFSARKIAVMIVRNSEVPHVKAYIPTQVPPIGGTNPPKPKKTNK